MSESADQITRDDEAPYGRRADGTPRAKPGRPPSAAPSRKKPTAPKKGDPINYEDGINRLFVMVSGGLLMAGQKKPVLLADAMAVGMHGPTIARGIHELALDKPEIAGVLDKILSVGPYGELLTGVLGLGFQLGANRDLVPAGMFGTHPKEDLVAGALAQVAAAVEYEQQSRAA